jgi:hypothetical protein
MTRLEAVQGDRARLTMTLQCATQENVRCGKIAIRFGAHLEISFIETAADHHDALSREIQRGTGIS